ncbi:MAG: hypothetical protein P4L20_19560 [Acidimicrobiales bacterium]|nr:hypothetical protein [Acidimicrobiales bacterium]
MAAKIAPRVSVRSRDRALSLFSGVFGWSMGDMTLEYLLGGKPLSHHARIDSGAAPAVGLL